MMKMKLVANKLLDLEMVREHVPVGVILYV